jgi:hypothetical protein
VPHCARCEAWRGDGGQIVADHPADVGWGARAGTARPVGSMLLLLALAILGQVDVDGEYRAQDQQLVLPGGDVDGVGVAHGGLGPVVP